MLSFISDTRLAVWLTFAGVALSGLTHHQRGTVSALGRAGEGLDAQLVSFRLHKQNTNSWCNKYKLKPKSKADYGNEWIGE